MLNTDAESVDDIVAARSRHVTRGMVNPILSQHERRYMKPPVSNVVRMTPAVDSTRPGPSTGLISLNLVSMPPVNNITLRAIMPMNCA